MQLSRLLPSAARGNQILPVALRLSQDPCWRVRWSVAKNIANLCETLEKSTIEKLVLESYVKLLQDSEAEVRTSAAGSIARFSKFVSKAAILEKLLPCMNSLVSDPSEHVRSALASEIMGVASFDKASTATHLIPLYLRLLKDTSSDVRNVRA